MTQPSPMPLVVIVVPNGTLRPEPLAAAVRRIHPAWDVCALWAGDPHVRPALTGELEWVDAAPATDDLHPAWQRTLVSHEGLNAEWVRVLTVTGRLLEVSARPVVALWAGAVAVLGPIDAVVPGDGVISGNAMGVIVRHVRGPIPDDGAAPTEADLMRAGNSSPHVIGLSASAAPLIEWLLLRITESPEYSIGTLLDRAFDVFPIASCHDAAIGVGRWRWDITEPRLVDLAEFDPDQPWVLDPNVGDRARIDVIGHPDRIRSLASAAGQLRGARQPVVLPGGITIDPAMRTLVADARADAVVPPPWTAPGPFRDWLQPRYWSELHRARRDLAVAFANPRSVDEAAFRTWSRRAFIDDEIPLLVGVPGRHTDHWSTAAELSPDGINLVGYHTRESSLGDVVRRIHAAVDAAGVNATPLAVQRTASPELVAGRTAAHRIGHAVTLAVVNADQFPALQMDHPELFSAGARTIGYWFWELEHVPEPMRAAIDLVDEIWAGSTFVANAFAAVTDCPVRCVPIPVPQPSVSIRDRASFVPLVGLDGRFVFAVVFDHFSVTERKNPVGAIEAFKLAFQPGDGPVLVVKSMNAERRWPQHQRVLAAVDGRPDVIVWDEHLDRDDHMAFIGCVDALVSLHRSEGLGLHLAEAMWLGTPVIATRYSGNLDFMDDECSVLIDAAMTTVEHGEGVYPPEAHWADPDLELAAAAMRRLVSEPRWAAELAAAALQRMQQQPTLAETGSLIAELLGVRVAS